ncbi:VRR-NUC domain-containing protein [Cellvibrio mixtus]|uniref:VRR-NUC domain-containing protein n=1 Tax=Cellvibrio mixtus TaxID=39650 RepID=UPI000587EC08|nr:VRR-NUC domain-containing protein [Cellvibrio mixtus]
MSNTSSEKPDLASDYYLTNFQFLVDWVVQRYADLLNEDEREFVSRFQQLERDSQCLLVRLSSRKGPLFRRSKLRYAEIDSIDEAALKLIQAGLLSNNQPLSLSELCDSLTKGELLQLFKAHINNGKHLRKEEIVADLIQQFPAPKLWREWTENQLGDAYYLDNRSIISNLLLLFFGNTYQDLTEFVLQDLGLYRYENYVIDQQHRIFKSRSEIEQYQLLMTLREQLERAATLEDLIHITTLLPTTATSNKLERRRARLCNQLAYQLERANEQSLALKLYTQNEIPPARERRIRLLEKQGELSAAWVLLQEIQANPFNEEELQIARRMTPRLAKKLGEPSIQKTLPTIIEKYLELGAAYDDEGNRFSVEEAARQFLHTDNAPCFYVENILLTGLFGLWLWPEMFRGIEGAFANPFQIAPLDMYQEDFARNRPGLQQLWDLFDQDNHHQHIFSVWDDKYGIANALVNWSILDRELIAMALDCIPKAHLKRIFERLLFDLKSNRSGLPDLIQFYPAEKTYCMIEIKGPGDRIQDNQERWLKYFSLHGIPAEVCYVRWR